jgi:hypothetical protein
MWLNKSSKITWIHLFEVWVFVLENKSVEKIKLTQNEVEKIKLIQNKKEREIYF